MNQRGQYGSYSVPSRHTPRIGDATVLASTRGPHRIPVNIGILGVGLAVGLAAWPGVKKKTPLGFIAMGASGSMVALGLTELIFGGL